jgi:Transglycosylase SLT domain
MRRVNWMVSIKCAGAVFALIGATDGSAKAKAQVSAETGKHSIEKKAASVQQVTFPDTEWNPVKIVRGASSAKDRVEQKPRTEKIESAEIVSFADPTARPVRVVRGETEHKTVGPERPHPANGMITQIVTFANFAPVSILRGSPPQDTDIELFGPASVPELDRVTFAVDGAESSHGADIRMWRPQPSEPQGPMQVSAAAAIDVGGGDRFDLAENRALGRAYLARLYRRYGNWPDAIAAYNWGPGNVDFWIAGDRVIDKLPLEVERYRDRVLRDAALAQPSYRNVLARRQQ